MENHMFLEKVKYFGLRKLYYLILRAQNSMREQIYDAGFPHPSFQQTIIKRRISRKLVTQFGGSMGQNTETQQYFLGFGLIHYALVRNTKPTHILCIGSQQGFMPALLGLACKDNGMGHVDFVDAGYDRNEPARHYGGIGFWKKIDPSKHFAVLGVSGYISSHIMTTKEYASRYPNKRFDYVYIDGDHSYKGVKLDYSLFWPKLNKGGFMLLHDIIARGFHDKGQNAVWKFWNELPNEHKISFSFPKESGLGILQKA